MHRCSDFLCIDAGYRMNHCLMQTWEYYIIIATHFFRKNIFIAGFARACFNYGLDLHQDVWFATKDTISKKYDHTFKDIFQEIYDNEYKEKFEAAGIEYFYTLIDDAASTKWRNNSSASMRSTVSCAFTHGLAK